MLSDDMGKGPEPVKLADVKIDVKEFGVSIPYEGLVNDLSAIDHVFQDRLLTAMREAQDHHIHQVLGTPYAETCPVCTRPPEPESEPERVKLSLRGFIDYLRQRLALWIGGDNVQPVYTGEDDWMED